jgi:hypothetical protein
MADEDYRKEISETVEHIAARWTKPDKRILRRVFPLLAEGQPVPVTRIVQAMDSESSVVERALELGRAGRDEKGRVTELFGIQLTPTMHRIEVDGIALFSCCAVTAHLVPDLTQRPAIVESVDPVSRQVVRLTVTTEGVQSVEPGDAVGTLVRTDLRGVMENVGVTFCRHVCHFASSESADEFVARDSKRYILEIGEFRDVARELYTAIWQ